MRRLKLLTSGESHGDAMFGILEYVPSGLELSKKDFEADMERRRSGFGRSKRMKVETDDVEIQSGVRKGLTTGAPITIRIENKLSEKYKSIMNIEKESVKEDRITTPRPGHADYTGAMKFQLDDIRDVIERASGRETAVRTALGIIAKKFLREFDIEIISRTLKIGNIDFNYKNLYPNSKILEKSFANLKSEVEKKSEEKASELKRLRQKLEKKGDTCGGAFQVIAHKIPVGLGSYTQWDLRLDANLSKAIMSIHSVKSCSIGAILKSSCPLGSEYSDEFEIRKGKILRKTNNLGGIEGGISNGEPLILSGVVKPVPTVSKPRKTVDLKSKKEKLAFYENADYWVVEAVGVIAESMVALILMDEFLVKFGGDSMKEIHSRYIS